MTQVSALNERPLALLMARRVIVARRKMEVGLQGVRGQRFEDVGERTDQ